jgi:hypothetical protein
LNFRGHSLKHGRVELDRTLRLFQKRAVSFSLRAGEVEVVSSSNRVGQLKFPLIHETCSDLGRHLEQLVRAAGTVTETTNGCVEQPSLRAVLWNAPWQFFKSYILHGGFLDGWAGLHASILPALGVYLREAMLWESQQPTAQASATTGEDEVGPTVLRIPSPFTPPVAAPNRGSDGRQARAAA